MYKWILIFCLPLASVAKVSLCSKHIANLTNMPKTTGFLQTLRAVFARENTTHEQTPAAAAIQGSRSVQPLDPILVERSRKPAGRPIFTKGLDEANRMIQLAERLRDSQIDPHTTHIPEFADDIQKHISFIKKGIKKSGEEKRARLKALAELKKEALEKAKNKQVTYEWWLSWNERLSIAGSIYTNTYTLSRISITNQHTNSIYQDIIMIPTISELGIQAFNRSSSQNVFPLGVVNQATFTDGILMTPYNFFSHDVEHSTKIINRSEYSALSKIENNFNINLYQELQKLDLSLEQQEMIGLVYFTIWHEQLLDIVQDRTEPTKFEILLNNLMIRRFQNKNGLGRLLPVSVNADSREEIEAYLNESIKFFIKLVRQILESAARTNNPSLTSAES